MWIAECLDSVCSDMHVFHDVADIGELDGPTFFRMAYRLPAYEGASRLDLAGWLEEIETEELLAEQHKYPPRYIDEVSLETMREKEGRVVGTSVHEDRAATLAELAAAGPPAPILGQNAPIFEMPTVTD
jgi:hypothetical protein